MPLAYDEDTQTLIHFSDSQVTLYDLPSGKILRQEAIHNLPDAFRSKSLFCAENSMIYLWGAMACSGDGIDAYDAVSLEYKWTFLVDQPDDNVFLSPDKSVLAITACCKHMIYFVDAKTGDLKQATQCYPSPRKVSQGIGFSACGNFIFSSEGSAVSKVEIASGDEVSRTETGGLHTWFDQAGSLHALDVDDDEKTRIKYMVDSQVRRLPNQVPAKRWSGTATSADGLTLALAADYSRERRPWPVAVFDLRTQALVGVFVEPEFAGGDLNMIVGDGASVLAVESGDLITVFHPRKSNGTPRRLGRH